MKTTTQSQFGRSMLEILGVLAVVGVLTMAGISGYQYALQKQRANTVVHEAHLARVDALGIDGEHRNWEVVRFHPKSGYVMLSSKDEDGIWERLSELRMLLHLTAYWFPKDVWMCITERSSVQRWEVFFIFPFGKRAVL